MGANGSHRVVNVNLANVRSLLIKYEGRVGYLYRCTGGKVTVGVGHACETAADAGKLPLMNTAGTAASSEQIDAAFSAVSTSPLGLIASHYRAYSDLRLSEDAIDELLDSDIVNFTAELRKRLPKFDSYPDSAQDALFDMAYNLGIGGLLKFHNLIAACDAGDWERAAQESARNGIGVERNQGTAELFRAAKPA